MAEDVAQTRRGSSSASSSPSSPRIPPMRAQEESASPSSPREGPRESPRIVHEERGMASPSRHMEALRGGGPMRLQGDRGLASPSSPKRDPRAFAGRQEEDRVQSTPEEAPRKALEKQERSRGLGSGETVLKAQPQALPHQHSNGTAAGSDEDIWKTVTDMRGCQLTNGSRPDDDDDDDDDGKKTLSASSSVDSESAAPHRSQDAAGSARACQSNGSVHERNLPPNASNKTCDTAESHKKGHEQGKVAGSDNASISLSKQVDLQTGKKHSHIESDKDYSSKIRAHRKDSAIDMGDVGDGVDQNPQHQYKRYEAVNGHSKTERVTSASTDILSETDGNAQSQPDRKNVLCNKSCQDDVKKLDLKSIILDHQPIKNGIPEVSDSEFVSVVPKGDHVISVGESGDVVLPILDFEDNFVINIPDASEVAKPLKTIPSADDVVLGSKVRRHSLATETNRRGRFTVTSVAESTTSEESENFENPPESPIATSLPAYDANAAYMPERRRHSVANVLRRSRFTVTPVSSVSSKASSDEVYGDSAAKSSPISSCSICEESKKMPAVVIPKSHPNRNNSNAKVRFHVVDSQGETQSDEDEDEMDSHRFAFDNSAYEDDNHVIYEKAKNRHTDKRKQKFLNHRSFSMPDIGVHGIRAKRGSGDNMQFNTIRDSVRVSKKVLSSRRPYLRAADAEAALEAKQELEVKMLARSVEPRPDDHMQLACVTWWCCCNWLLGPVALYCAVSSSRAYERRAFRQARRCARLAFVFSILSVVTTVAVVTTLLALYWPDKPSDSAQQAW